MELETDMLPEDVTSSETPADSSAIFAETVVIPEDRPIMTTPLNDYSVTEGLLLLILLWLVGAFLWDLIRRVF